MRMQARQEMNFHGTNGLIRLTAPFNPQVFGQAEVHLFKEEGNLETFSFPRENHYVKQLEAFCSSVKELQQQCAGQHAHHANRADRARIHAGDFLKKGLPLQGRKSWHEALDDQHQGKRGQQVLYHGPSHPSGDYWRPVSEPKKSKKLLDEGSSTSTSLPPPNAFP